MEVIIEVIIEVILIFVIIEIILVIFLMLSLNIIIIIVFGFLNNICVCFCLKNYMNIMVEELEEKIL